MLDLDASKWPELHTLQSKVRRATKHIDGPVTLFRERDQQTKDRYLSAFLDVLRQLGGQQTQQAILKNVEHFLLSELGKLCQKHRMVVFVDATEDEDVLEQLRSCRIKTRVDWELFEPLEPQQVAMQSRELLAWFNKWLGFLQHHSVLVVARSTIAFAWSSDPKQHDHYKMGMVLSKQGRLDEAIVAYQTQVELEPQHQRAWNSLGNVFMLQGELDEAISAYQQQVTVAPEHGQAWSHLAGVFFEQGHFDEAVEAYQLQLKVNPEHEYVWFNMGNTFLRQDKPEQAIAAYQKQVDHYPEDDSAWLNMGIALEHLERFDQAIAAHRKQAAITPEHPRVWYCIGNLLLYQEPIDLDEAIAAFQQQIAIAPDHEEVWCGLGNAFRRQGRFDEALEAYQKQIEVVPEHVLLIKSWLQ